VGRSCVSLAKQVGQAVVDQYTQRLDNFERAYEQGGFIGALDAGTEYGALVFDGIGLATGVVGAAP
jgi:hypothetical protein